MAEGIQIKNLPSTTTIKQGDTMTIVQDKQNKQLSLDVFANESDLATLSPLENRCDEVKNKIEVDEYSAEITTSQSMSKIGSDDSGANLHENVLDGAYESCVLKGKTKYIDNDTQEILDTFQDGRNLSLIDVKAPILSNIGKNLFDENEFYRSWKNDNSSYIYEEYVDGKRVFKVYDGNALFNNGGYRIKVKQGEQYTFSVTLKQYNTATTSNVFVLQNGDTKVGYHNHAFTCSSNTWVVRKVTFVAQENFVRLGSGYNGGNYFYAKDMSLTSISDDNSYEPYKSNILSFNQKDDKTIVLRSLPDGTCDTLNVETSEYVQKIGERSYQDGDTNSNTLVTDGTKTQYKLSSPIITKVDVQGFPHAYKNGHIQLSSGSIEPSLTPTVTYKVPVSRVGQIASNTKSNLRQTIKLDQLEVLVYQSLINTEYENLLVQNSVESATSFTNLSTNDPKDGLYYMLKHLIEENQPVQNMLDKINLFYLYGLLSDEHYFDLLLGGEEDVY